jgi:Meiotically Up-regulated Gene 113 (MUG113) protein
MSSYIFIGGVLRPRLWIYGARMLIPEYEHAPIKIGITGDPERRIQGLHASGPFPIRWLGVWPAKKGRDTEEAIFAKFASDRLGGEWFYPNPDIFAFIADNTRRFLDLFARAIEKDRKVTERARKIWEYVSNGAESEAFAAFEMSFSAIARRHSKVCTDCGATLESVAERDSFRWLSEEVRARIIGKPYPLLLRAEGVAEMLGTSVEEVERLRLAGVLDYFPLTRKEVRYRHADLLKFLETPAGIRLLSAQLG